MLGHVCQFFMTKRHNSLVSNLKIRFKFDLGLLDGYKLMYFNRNINGNKDGKIVGGNYCVLCNNLRIYLSGIPIFFWSFC